MGLHMAFFETQVAQFVFLYNLPSFLDYPFLKCAAFLKCVFLVAARTRLLLSRFLRRVEVGRHGGYMSPWKWSWLLRWLCRFCLRHYVTKLRIIHHAELLIKQLEDVVKTGASRVFVTDFRHLFGPIYLHVLGKAVNKTFNIA